MRVKRIKWKKAATHEQLQEAKELLHDSGATMISTFPKVFDDDTWTTNVRYA